MGEKWTGGMVNVREEVPLQLVHLAHDITCVSSCNQLDYLLGQLFFVVASQLL